MTPERLPVVGITCTEIQSAQSRYPLRVGQNRSYIRAVIGAGAAPLLIPNLADMARLQTIFQLLDGLLLPGGVDIAPAQYGEERHEKCGPVSPDRDETELALAGWALEMGKPLLAICRGIQVLNVALGGSLYQDIQTQIPGAQKHDWYPGYPRDRHSHPVVVAPQTRLADIVGTDSLAVNSLHHQAVKKVAPGLDVTAHAPDGVIEAAEVKDHPFAVAVQWHPEELVSSDMHAQRLFDALVKACQT